MRRLAALVALLLAVLVAPVVHADQSGLTDTAEQTFSQLAGCVAGAEQTNILLVVDESQSLQSSDPDSKRSDALRIALSGIADLQRAAPDKKIMVAASSFSTDYTPRIGWQQADDGSIAALKDFATRDVPQLDTGQGTDYRKALQGARTQLQEAGEGCQVLLWFTDGGLDVGRSTDAEKARAYDEICAVSGISDSLRADRIFVIAVALFNPDLNAITDTDRQRLQDIAEGSATGLADCGSSPVPESYARGAYLPASDANRLAEVFGGAISRIGGYTLNGRVLCPSPQCPDGILEVAVDAGIKRLRISAYTASGDPRLALTPPGGSQVQVAEDVATIGSAPTDVAGSGAATQIDLDVSDPANVGSWTLQVTGGEAWIETWYSPEAAFVLNDPEQTVSAEQATDVAITLQHRDGSLVDLDDYRTGTLTASVAGTPVSVDETDSSTWTIEVPPVSGAVLPRTRVLDVSMALTTTPSDIELTPIEQQFSLPVTTSAAYPQVLSEELRFPDVSQAGTVTTGLQVQGAQTGPSEVCITSTSFSGPSGPLDLSATDKCVKLEANETSTIEFAVAPDEVVDGQVAGTVDVELRSARSGDEPLTVQVPANMGMSRPVDTVKFTLLGILFVLLAISLPLLIVYLIGRWVLAKFVPRDLRYCVVPVTVHKNSGGDYSLRSPGQSMLDIDPTELRWRAVPANSREVEVAGLRLSTNFKFMRSRSLGALRVPWLAVDASATAHLMRPDARVLASNANPYELGPGRAPANLRLERNWFLVARASEVDPEEGFDAQLIAFGMGPGFPHAEMSDRTPTVLVERMVHALRRAARETPSVPASPQPAGQAAGPSSTPTTPPTNHTDDWL